MDLLRLLESISRQIQIQKDKNEAIKQQEQALREELAAAQAHHAERQARMEEEQKNHLAIASEVQHQQSANTEFQAANTALRMDLKSIHRERVESRDLLNRMQDNFVEDSRGLDSQAQGLAMQSHHCLMRQSNVADCLRCVATIDVVAAATPAAQHAGMPAGQAAIFDVV